MQKRLSILLSIGLMLTAGQQLMGMEVGPLFTEKEKEGMLQLQLFKVCGRTESEPLLLDVKKVLHNFTEVRLYHNGKAQLTLCQWKKTGTKKSFKWWKNVQSLFPDLVAEEKKKVKELGKQQRAARKKERRRK